MKKIITQKFKLNCNLNIKPLMKDYIKLVKIKTKIFINI